MLAWNFSIWQALIVKTYSNAYFLLLSEDPQCNLVGLWKSDIGQCSINALSFHMQEFHRDQNSHFMQKAHRILKLKVMTKKKFDQWHKSQSLNKEIALSNDNDLYKEAAEQ